MHGNGVRRINPVFIRKWNDGAMPSPVSRLPLDAARLAVLQQRAVPKPSPQQAPSVPALRERPIPPEQGLAATPRRGSLLDIVA